MNIKKKAKLYFLITYLLACLTLAQIGNAQEAILNRGFF